MHRLEFHEFLELLQEDFPKLANEPPRIRSYVQPGWYEIVYDACGQIEELIDSEDDCFLAQIKEKFGALRLYVDINDPDLADAINTIIGDAERISAETCEECGAPGSVVSVRNWAKTLCERCESANRCTDGKQE